HPDAHAVIALTEEKHVANTRDAGQLVLHLHQGQVAQVKLVVAAIGRVDGQAHKNIGRALDGGDACLLDDVGQQGDGEIDAVLHHHLGDVDIDALLERYGEIVAAIVGALRRHIEDAFDAVDLLFDGRCHGVGDL